MDALTALPPGLNASPTRDILRNNSENSLASLGSAASQTPANAVEVTMGACVKSGDYAGALAAFASAERVTTRMLNLQYTAKTSSGFPLEQAAMEMLEGCAKNSIKPTAALYNNVLASLTRKGRPEAVISWAQQMTAGGIKLDRVACNTLLKAYSEVGNLQEAVTMLTTMMRGDALPSPDAVSFNTIISALAHSGEPQKAEEVLNTMADTGLKPDAHSFTGVISGYARAAKPEKAAHVLQRMLSLGVPPDTAVFNAVLLAFANSSDAAGALRTFSEFEQRTYDECPNAAPDLVSYNTLISACARAGQPVEAEQAFHRLVAQGLKPDQVSFSTVLSAHARAGNTAKAQAWLDQMLQTGISPDAVTFNTICSAHARVGDAKTALKCLEAMGRAGVEASPATHAIMVNALIQAGDSEGAEAGLRRLVTLGEKLSASSFNSLISMHAKARNPQRAASVFTLMCQTGVEPSLITYNALANAYANCGDIDAVERCLAQASARHLALDRFSYGALLTACAKSSAPKAQVRKRAEGHIQALLHSATPLNDFLTNACTRAIGESSFRQLREAARKAHPGRSAAAPEAAIPSTPSTEQIMGGAADGWTTVTTAKNHRNSRSSKPPSATPRRSPRFGAQASTPASASQTAAFNKPRRTHEPSSQQSAIQKKTSTPAEAAKPMHRTLSGEVRLTGVTLTRSKSARARLLHLAEDALQDSSICGPGLPLTRSAASELALSLNDLQSPPKPKPTGLPLKRSVGSELAISLDNHMSL